MHRKAGALLASALLAGVVAVTGGVAAAAKPTPTLTFASNTCPPPPPYVSPGTMTLAFSPTSGKVGTVVSWTSCGTTPFKQMRVQVMKYKKVFYSARFKAGDNGGRKGSFKMPKVPGTRPLNVIINHTDIKTGVWRNYTFTIVN